MQQQTHGAGEGRETIEAQRGYSLALCHTANERQGCDSILGSRTAGFIFLTIVLYHQSGGGILKWVGKVLAHQEGGAGICAARRKTGRLQRVFPDPWSCRPGRYMAQGVCSLGDNRPGHLPTEKATTLIRRAGGNTAGAGS